MRVITNANLVAAQFNALASRIEAEVVQDSVDTCGTLLLAEVKNNASGRPGPNVITGTYIGSISLEKENGSDGYKAIVYTDEEYGDDLEYGNSRIGSFPHFRPALEDIEPTFVSQVNAQVRRTIH